MLTFVFYPDPWKALRNQRRPASYVLIERCHEEIHFFQIKSNQIIFIGLRSSKDYYKRPRGGVGIWEGSFVGRCVLREWVVSLFTEPFETKGSSR